MTLDEAIEIAEDLKGWLIEGDEDRIRDDVDAIDILISSAKEKLKEM